LSLKKLNIRPHRGQLVRRDIHAIHCKVGSKDRYQPKPPRVLKPSVGTGEDVPKSPEFPRSKNPYKRRFS
jgi:hypothetical protein